MERALRAARPAGLLAARCVPTVPSTLRTAPRRLLQPGRRLAARPTGFVNQPRTHGFATTARHYHPEGETVEGAGEATAKSATPSGAKDSQAAQTDPGSAPRPKLKDSKPTKQVQTDAGIVEWNEEWLKFRFLDGKEGQEGQGEHEGRSCSVSTLWLRDACPCHLCVDPDSGQKNFSTTDLTEPLIEHAELAPDRSLKITWTNDPPSGGNPHTTVFPAEEVAAWQNDYKWQRTRPASTINSGRICWDRAEYEALLAQGRCRIGYKDWINDEAAFWRAFADLRQTGLIFITDVPSDETEVERVAGRIGPLQHTFYGWTWDVKSKPHAENVAYTSKFLGLHQDLMYYNPIPGLQLLHCLSNSCEGGESLFSHGARAALELKLNSPKFYDTLTKTNSFFSYRKGEHHYFASRRTIDAVPKGAVYETRWAPPFQANFHLASDDRNAHRLRQWKLAATAFQTIAESESNMVEVKLKEGECVIFDNRQILHGRRQFATGEGTRWLKGAYVGLQTYNAKGTELVEYMRAAGLPPLQRKSVEEEERDIKASLEARNSSANKGAE